MLPQEKEAILIVDDQPSLGETLKRFLTRKGYRATSCTRVDEALDYLVQENVDLVLTDVCMPEKDGLELLAEIQSRGGNEAVVVMTAFGTINQSVETMRRGASDYIVKPFRLEEVENIVDQALRRRRELLELNAPNGSRHATSTMIKANSTKSDSAPSMRLIGHSRVMKEMLTIIERIAPRDSSVLITGATGTGKELVALQIHEKSERRGKPFVDLNCSAIPDTLIEAELFGYQRGAFTGADETRPGLFEEASGGTLFLDEVDALSLSSQAKLLRVLQERHVRRVGGRKNIPIDVRIISATNKDLHQAVLNGTFRHDLLYRLCVVPTHIPELRERLEDLPLLIEYFLKQDAARRGTGPKVVAPEAMKALLEYRWPGNVRELENALEYALAVGVDEELGINDLPPAMLSRRSAPAVHPVLQECLEGNLPLSEVERRYVLSMLERYDGHQINTAAALGIDRRTLSRRLQQYGSRILRTESDGKSQINTF